MRLSSVFFFIHILEPICLDRWQKDTFISALHFKYELNHISELVCADNKHRLQVYACCQATSNRWPKMLNHSFNIKYNTYKLKKNLSLIFKMNSELLNKYWSFHANKLAGLKHKQQFCANAAAFRLKVLSHPSKEYLLVFGMSRISIRPWFPRWQIEDLCIIATELTAHCRLADAKNPISAAGRFSPVDPATIAFSFLWCLQHRKRHEKVNTLNMLLTLTA